ncbi:hypothetical protein L0Z72_15275, partial [candidate division KSB1 bacterium]|nr:hypothetical protein [candidate division KSB1 bacterium]
MKTKRYFRLMPITIVGTVIFLLFLILPSCNNKQPTESNEPETNTVTDIDGNKYRTIKIGNQIWMA